MRISMKRLLAAVSTTVLLAAAGIVALAQPAVAAANPTFVVTCYPQQMANNDPIVFPGQAGKAHSHTFFGAAGVDENTTVDSLLAQSSSDCGSHFDRADLSAYWIPTLYQNGQAVYSGEQNSQQLRAYYRLAGGVAGEPVDQAFPRGLRMIAGDMRATTPQPNVSYACAKTNDTGVQWGGTAEFLSCGADETLIAKLVFPDCWDGVNLDSADHKSHMAFSSGPAGSCPADHPVKLPQLTFEGWYYGTNGAASSFAWSSGGAYSFHGDVISAWDPTAAANLVNQCINVPVDCNATMYENIPQGPVSQSQIDAQLAGVAPAAPAPATPTTGGEHAGHETPTATPTPTATATPRPTPTVAPEPSTPVALPEVTVEWRDGDAMSLWSAIRATVWTLLKQWGFV